MSRTITMLYKSLFCQVAENFRQIQEEIHEAAARSGRDGAAIRMIAVSKYAVPADGMVEAILATGCYDLGEARPQQLLEKAEYYGPVSADGRAVPIRWHLIGSLQRNKVRKVLAVTSLIHSIDSVRLAEAVDRVAGEERLDKPVRCLLEVAISSDETKHGFLAEQIPAALDELGRMNHLSIEGLMCMSGLKSDETETRREFATVRNLSESLRDRGLPPNVQMGELSMGMSDDFKIAVEEGATILRIGSKLYPH